jgi:hypothetical protein
VFEYVIFIQNFRQRLDLRICMYKISLPTFMLNVILLLTTTKQDTEKIVASIPKNQFPFNLCFRFILIKVKF